MPYEPIVVQIKGGSTKVITAPSGSATRLVDLIDVSATPRANGDVLTYVVANNRFEFHPGQGGSGGTVSGNGSVAVAQLSSNVDQTPANTNPNAVTFDSQDYINGIGHTIGQSRIYAQSNGTYFIVTAMQVGRTLGGGEGPKFVDNWINYNGVDVANSSVRAVLTDVNDTFVLVGNFIVPMTIGDYVEVMQAVEQAGLNLGGHRFDGLMGAPTVPSIIFTMFKLSGSEQSFTTIEVSGEDTLLASSSNTLTFIAGNNVSLVTDAVNNSIRISSAGGLGSLSNVHPINYNVALSQISHANSPIVPAGYGNSAIVPKVVLDASGHIIEVTNVAIEILTTAVIEPVSGPYYFTVDRVRGNVSNTTPINYDSTTGVFSHALSGVTATTYGNTTFVPQITVDNRGHVTSITNTAIALPPSTDEFARAQANAAFLKANGAVQTAFPTINVAGQSDVVADSNTDILTFIAGSNITITTDAPNDTITFASTGGGGGGSSNSFVTINISGQANVVATSNNDTLRLVAGNGIILTANSVTDTITITANNTGGTPAGAIQFFSQNTVPNDSFLAAEGQDVSRTGQAELFDEIGVMYGSGDGSTTFRLPKIAPQFETWIRGNNVPALLEEHTQTLLNDGRVILTGGINNNSGNVTSNVWFGVVSGNVFTWTIGTGLPAIRYHSTATLLSDDRILILGGRDGGGGLQTTAYFGVITGDSVVWTTGTELPQARTAHATAYLPDGRVLVTGGTSTENRATFGTISGDTISWADGTDLSVPKQQHTITTLDDGRVVIIAGRDNVGGIVDTVHFGTISANTITWVAGNPLPFTKSEHATVLMANNRVLVIGGVTSTPGYGVTAFPFLGTIDGDVIAWVTQSAIPSSTGQRQRHSASLLSDKRVAIIGGYNGVATSFSDVRVGIPLYPGIRTRGGDGGGGSGGSGGPAFGVVNVAGQSDVVADASSDTLTLVAGSGMVITTDAPNDTITIASTGGAATDQFARDKANGAFAHANGAYGQANAATTLATTANTVAASAYAQANIATSNADAAFARANAAYANANTAIYTAAQIRANISNTAPINYSATTGVISHADSGVGATTYGNATFVPTVTVDARGHVTSVVNTAITFPADAVTSVAGRTGVVVLNTNDVTENTSGPFYHTSARVRGNVSNTAPINYDSTTGIFSHALSGVTATGHGDAATVPSFIVNATGHVTSITNTAIAISAAAITSGTLAVNRGGTGQTAITVNGSLLIGNTVSGGYDVNALTQGTGILITNDKGSITIAATGGSALDQFARDTANGAFAQANIARTNADAAFANANTAIYTAAQIRANISNTTPIRYDVDTGVISHAVAGIIAGLYGTPNTIPAFLVNAFGHVTDVSNTPIAIESSAVTESPGGPFFHTAARVRGNVSNTAPINYEPSTGIFSHANSSVTPTTYGNATFVPVVTVDARGHITSVVNTAISFPPGGVTSVAGRTGAIVLDTFDVTENAAGPFYHTSARVRGNVSNTTPVNYDSTTGIFSHATSGVTATGYGTAAQVPVFVVNATGHVTSVTNTSIAIDTTAVSEAAGGPFFHTAARVRANISNTAPINYNSTTGVVSHADSGVTATGHGSASIVPVFIVNATGHVTSVTNTSIAILSAAVTESGGGPFFHTAARVRGNVSNTAPINYDSTTGIFSHALSGVAATTYGTAAQVPVFTVNTFGLVTAVTNTAITIAASAITSGTLVAARGGTGQTAVTLNGSILIANSVSAGYDLNRLTAGSGILINNDKGSIEIVATGGSAIDQFARDKANGAAQQAFITVNVAGQSDIVADSNNDTLTFVSGNGMSITTNSISDTITFESFSLGEIYAMSRGFAMP